MATEKSSSPGAKIVPLSAPADSPGKARGTGHRALWSPPLGSSDYRNFDSIIVGRARGNRKAQPTSLEVGRAADLKLEKRAAATKHRSESGSGKSIASR
jgi:hypothetical protein